jgi:hypothetical protein
MPVLSKPLLLVALVVTRVPRLARALNVPRRR